MRIAHICPFVGEQLGGSERYVSNLTRLQSQEHDVHIITTTHSARRAGTEIKDNVTIHRVHAPIVIWNINPLALIIKPLLKESFDIFHIHSHLYTTSNQSAFIAQLRRRKSLLHLHGGVGTPPYATSLARKFSKQVYDRTLGYYTIKSCNMIASVSQQDLKVIENEYGISSSKLRYIPNAVNTDEFKNPHKKQSKDGIILLYVGDIEHWKGIDHVINWLTKLSKESKFEFTMRFVGQGELLSNLVALKRKLADTRSKITIEILGEKTHSEIPAIMQDADALILPSYWEGLPTVILEAMASGLPVITTPVGDIPLVIKNRRTGFIINHTLDSFKLALANVCEHDPILDNIISMARNLVETQFCIDSIHNQVMEAYEDLLKEPE